MKIILAGFAVYRLARFLSFDDGPFLIFEKIRNKTQKNRTQKNDDIWATIDDWVSCPFCQGPYFALLISCLTLSKKGNFFITWMGLAGIQDFAQTIANFLIKEIK